MKKVYLAGPDVFEPQAIEIGKFKKQLCTMYGFEGLYPMDNEIIESDGRIDDAIYKANMKMIREADFGIFNLTPFRGVSADVGTVFELGCFVGQNKPVFGYTSGHMTYNERCGSRDKDDNGLTIENFGYNIDNLMIDCSIRDSFRFNDIFCNFEACLKFAKKYYQELHDLQQKENIEFDMSIKKGAEAP